MSTLTYRNFQKVFNDSFGLWLTLHPKKLIDIETFGEKR